VAVEKLILSKSTKIKSRQEALQSICSGRLDIFYPLILAVRDEKRLFQQPRLLTTAGQLSRRALLTLGIAFTGQVLRFDQDAYWGLGIGASIASRVPILGPFVVKLMLGGCR
jgi:hypothetical protein